MDKNIKKILVIKECPAKGVIWEKGEDGLFRCEKRLHFGVLEEWQIQHDLNHNYIQVIEYEYK